MNQESHKAFISVTLYIGYELGRASLQKATILTNSCVRESSYFVSVPFFNPAAPPYAFTTGWKSRGYPGGIMHTFCDKTLVPKKNDILHQSNKPILHVIAVFKNRSNRM